MDEMEFGRQEEATSSVTPVAESAANSLVVVGSLIMDLIVYARRFPRPGETLIGQRFVQAPGGKGLNQAIAAANAGASTRLIGAIGCDDFGKEFRALLATCGVNGDGLTEISEHPTGVGLPIVTEQGENAIVIVPEANGYLDPAFVHDTIAAGPQGGVLLMQLELPPAVNRAAKQAARDRNMTVVLNAAPIRDDIAEELRDVDYLVMNEPELQASIEQLFPGRTLGHEEQLKSIQSTLSLAGVIVTRGPHGAEYCAAGLCSSVSALLVDPIDTVGAGDTFVGYFAAALHTAVDFETAVQRACVAASLATLKRGAAPSIPISSQVDEALLSLREGG